MTDAKTSSKSPLLIIFIVVFLDLLGFGLVIPILPYYAKTFGASATALGWLMGSYSLMQFVFAPVWGRMSDLWGRRPILIASILGSAISLVILGTASSLPFLFLGRILAGLFGANISTASAYIADVTDEANRAKGMGIIGAGFGLGFLFGPAFGGILSQYGYGTPALVAAVLSLLNAVFAFFVLKEPPLDPKVREAHRTKRFDFKIISRTLSRRSTAHVTLVFFLVTMAFTQMECCFALFMKDRFQFDARAAGWCLAYMGLIMVVLQGGLVGRLSRKWGESKLSSTGIGFMIGALILMSLTRYFVYQYEMVYAAMTLIAIGNGINTPSLMSLVSQSAPHSERGAVMGVYQSAGSLARVLGPPAAGYLYDHHGIESPFIGAAGLMFIAFCATLFWFNNQRKSN